MFRKDVKELDNVLQFFLRRNGFETPLLQRRLLAAWDETVGPVVARYTINKFIRNQTLFVQISMPALRAELGMRRRDLLQRLNQKVGGAQIITDIRFY